MRLGALIGGDGGGGGHRLRDRSSQRWRRARCSARSPVRASNGEEFHRGRPCRRARWPWWARPEGGRRRSGPTSPMRSRVGPSRGWAARLFSRLSPKTVVAVTGTNGKTSTVELTRQIWRMAGYSCRLDRHASASTTAEDQVSTGLTTPDIVTFLSNVAGLRVEGVTHVAFEASSHGLSQFRTEGLPVQAAAFHQSEPRSSRLPRPRWRPISRRSLRLFSEVVDAGGAAVVWADDKASRAGDRDCARTRAEAVHRGARRARTLKLVERTPTQTRPDADNRGQGAPAIR